MREHLQTALPAWAFSIVDFLLEPTVLWSVTIGSVLLFVLNAVGIPWFLARVPEDYFTRRERRQLGFSSPKPWQVAVRVAKNLLGVLLLVAGVAMLFLPGQGILTIFVATVLLDLPGKARLQRRFLAWRPIERAVNGLRRRAGRPPLITETFSERPPEVLPSTPDSR